MKVKKMTQHILAIILVVVMFVSSTPVTVFAVEPGDQSDPMALSASIENGMPGETVNVTVKISDNPGIASLKFYVDYDSALTLTAVDFKTSSNVMVTAPKPYTDPQPITMISPLNDYTGNGVFAVLTFKIKDDAVVGRAADIKITYDPKDVYNGADEPVDLAVTNGKVYVYDGRPGDVDGNGVVNTKDANTLFRHVSGWNVAVDSDAVDVNGDNEITTKDAIDLFRYVAGWDNVILYRGAVKHGHALTFVEAKNATCTENGYSKDHWFCEECSMYFHDAEGKTEISRTDILVYANHAEVIKFDAKAADYSNSGNIEYWQCESCGKYYSDKDCTVEIGIKDTVIPVLPVSYHSITYLNTKGANIPIEDMQFPEHLGKLELPKPKVEGYIFKQWHLKTADGEQVSIIEPQTSENMYLWAEWEKENYTITYRDVYGDKTTTPYTIEDSFEIHTPIWQGLTFSHWEDTSGKLTAYKDTTGVARVKLEQGTTGNIELIARWMAPENLIVPKTKNQIKTSGYDEDADVYWFIYELGTIKHVILDSIVDPHTHKGSSYAYNISQTVEVSETFAKSLSSATAESTTSHTDWSSIKGWADELTANFGVKVTSGIEGSLGKEKVASVSAKVETELSVGMGASVERSHQTQTGGSRDDSSETIKEIGSTFSYNETMSSTEGKSGSLTSADPVGTYKFVHAGDIDVYAFVIYDPTTKTYSLDVYSRLDNMSTTILYKPNSIDEDEFINGTLSYQIDTEAISSMINSAYYIKYDGTIADGGESMHLSVHPVGQSINLSPCTYTKTGHSLTGWWEKSDFTGTMHLPEENVKDLAEAGETITLYANWAPNIYKVELDPNGGTVISNELKVTYGDKYEGLPDLTNTREGYTFDGWFFNEKKITEDTDVTHAGNHTLTAEWSPKTYRVIYDLNGSSIKTNPSIGPKGKDISYGSSYSLDVPSTGYYEFEGWYTVDGKQLTDSSGVSVEPWAIANDITVYAHWKQTDEDYIYVATPQDLRNIAKDTSAKYMLIDNITNVGNWTPISSFSGELVGLGHTISGMTYSFYDGADVDWGMFTTLNSSAIIDRVNFRDCHATYVAPSEGYAIREVRFGFVAAYNYGKIYRCCFTDNTINIDCNTKVTDQYTYAGIIVCDNYGTIKECNVSSNAINLDSDTVNSDASNEANADDKCAVAIAGGICANNQSSGTVTGCSSLSNTITTRVCYISDEGETVVAASGGAIGVQSGTESGNEASSNTISAKKRYYEVKWGWNLFAGTYLKAIDLGGENSGDTGTIYART